MWTSFLCLVVIRIISNLPYTTTQTTPLSPIFYISEFFQNLQAHQEKLDHPFIQQTLPPKYTEKKTNKELAPNFTSMADLEAVCHEGKNEFNNTRTTMRQVTKHLALLLFEHFPFRPFHVNAALSLYVLNFVCAGAGPLQ